MTAETLPVADAPAPVFPELGGAEYAALRDDIAERGVLVPVEVCATTGQVLDGRARVRACAELGIARYPRLVRAGLLTDEDRQAHSRALNLLRRHLSAGERAAHVRALRLAGWSSRRIAAETGSSQSTVVRDLRTAGEPGDSPAAVVGSDGKTYPARAAGRRASVYASSRGEQARAEAALAALGPDAPAREIDLRRAERLARDAAAAARRTGPAPVLPQAADVRHCDLRDLDVEPGSVDLILTDPDYTAAGIGGYDALGALAARALRPGSLLVAYTGQMHLPTALALLAEHLPYWWTFAAVHDTGTGVGQVRQRNLGCAWKPLIAFRQPGGDELPPWTLDVVRGGRREKDSGHDWQQAESEAALLVEALTRAGDLVLDPFCGSGTVPAAAVRAGRRVLACDVDAVSVRMTVERVALVGQERR